MRLRSRECASHTLLRGRERVSRRPPRGRERAADSCRPTRVAAASGRIAPRPSWRRLRCISANPGGGGTCRTKSDLTLMRSSRSVRVVISPEARNSVIFARSWSQESLAPVRRGSQGRRCELRGTDADWDTAARKQRKGREKLRDGEKPPDQQRELVRTYVFESLGSQRKRAKQALPRRD